VLWEFESGNMWDTFTQSCGQNVACTIRHEIVIVRPKVTDSQISKTGKNMREKNKTSVNYYIIKLLLLFKLFLIPCLLLLLNYYIYLFFIILPTRYSQSYTMPFLLLHVCLSYLKK